MIKIENVDVTGWEASIRGMRNPMNSWDKSDSKFIDVFEDDDLNTYYQRSVEIGPNDLDLMHRLYLGGPEHRKYLRMLHISMDITAPLYWWKEYDTYKVGTVADSCSTMHKIHAKEFVLDDFSHDHVIGYGIGVSCGHAVIPEYLLEATIDVLNDCRKRYLETKDKKWWWQMIQLLPTSYNQRRTVDFSYETAVTIIRQRTGHKLDEWRELVSVLLDLPYMREIMGVNTGV